VPARNLQSYKKEELELMSNKYDAIVIGAGIIGACVGFELAKQGKKSPQC